MIVAAAAAEGGWAPESFPDPQKDFRACGRDVGSWVCDPDGVLGRKGGNLLEGRIRAIAAGEGAAGESPCGAGEYPGFQFAIAVANKLAMAPGDTPAQAARKLAEHLHGGWGVGHAACDDGVLVLLAISDRQIYVSTGKGARARLSDYKVAGIIDGMRPHLVQGKYVAALSHALHSIDEGLKPTPWYLPDGAGGIIAAFVVICVVFYLKMFSGSGQANKFGDFKAKLEQLKQDQKAVKENRYNCKTCPICLEEFEQEVRSGAGVTASQDVDQAGELGAEGTFTTPTAPKGTEPTVSASSGPTAMASNPVAAPSETASSRGGGEEPRKRTPLSLPCGHAFCEECIGGWLEKEKNSCPICRKPIDGTDARPATSPGVSTRTWDEQAYADEFVFRLGSIGRLYPGYATPTNLRRWEDDFRLGRMLDTSPAEWLSAGSTWHSEGWSGGMGAFGGGGCSRGNGGAGGSW
ncbi:unnamed protein product [Ostreobium quekettii]|uniref:RING-type domain-containing protein n=1 Tax=Ostreobium quekettii TaxID=121088 RepID=A0A8S1INL5_9CHLO|nr:unnamed protein product [Ostreobium quekettii]|eukprot:evm.model.scf_856.2 EVM.evm.TU.scf_856.2   scf_856:18123-27956(+)